MQNKKAKQAEERKRHKEASKKARRRSAPNFNRRKPHLVEKPTILIVCEGESTEPSYFKQFRLSTATIKPIGEGYNTISLVNHTKYF